MPTSKYLLVIPTHSSFCPDCKGDVSLLCPIKLRTPAPSFYICWECKRVFQVGAGPVRKSEQGE